LLPHPSLAHISSSAPYSRTALAYVPISNERPSFTPIQWHTVMLIPTQPQKPEDHALSAVFGSERNIFAATFHIWRLSSPSATGERAMQWRQDTLTVCPLSIDNALYSYLGGIRVESRLGLRLPWLIFFVVFLIISLQIWGYYLD
jgi:hypothetical protein